MAAPEYMNDLRKSSQLGFGIYSWLQLVDLVCRHDMSEVYETHLFKYSGHMLLIILYIKIAVWHVTLSGNVCQMSSLNSSEDGV